MKQTAKKSSASNAENVCADASIERDGITGYGDKYRQDLSAKRLANDDLIENAVWWRTEAACLEVQVKDLKAQLSSIAKDSERVVKQVIAGESNKEILRQRQHLKGGAIGPPEFQLVLAPGFAPLGDKSILTAAEALLNNTPPTLANRKNARVLRGNTPHYRDVEKFRSDYIKREGGKHGWIAAAAAHFEVSTKTISRLVK